MCLATVLRHRKGIRSMAVDIPKRRTVPTEIVLPASTRYSSTLAL